MDIPTYDGDTRAGRQVLRFTYDADAQDDASVVLAVDFADYEALEDLIERLRQGIADAKFGRSHHTDYRSRQTHMFMVFGAYPTPLYGFTPSHPALKPST